MTTEPYDRIWECSNISGELIEEKARWLRDARGLHGKSLRFFDLAGKLLHHARSDYYLITPVFFHSILGLESALKFHYRLEKGYLKELLARAIADGLLHDGIFSPFPPLSKQLLSSRGKVRSYKTHLEKLAELIPAWRNEYFHGIYLLAPDYFHLTIQMREIADVLKTRRSRVAGL